MQAIQTEVCIFTRKDKPEEEAIVKEMERVTVQAAQIIRKDIDIKVSDNLRELANLSISAAMTPIITINGASAFAKDAPNLKKMQVALATTSSSGEMF